MKKYMTYAVTAFFATIAISLAAPDKGAVMAKEQAAWQAFKDKNADGFKKVVHADFRGVYDEGVSDMQKELDDMKKWDMKSFTISDYNIVSVGTDTVVRPTRSLSKGPMMEKMPPAPSMPDRFGKWQRADGRPFSTPM